MNLGKNAPMTMSDSWSRAKSPAIARRSRATKSRLTNRRLHTLAEALEPRHLLSALTVEVTGANLKESFNKAFKNAQVATFTSSDTTLKAAAFTATIDWGDGVTSVGKIKAVKNVPGKFEITGSHNYKTGLTQESPTETVDNASAGVTASASSEVNVKGAPFTEIPVDLTAVEGGPVDQTSVAEFNSHIKKFTVTGVEVNWNDEDDSTTGTVVPDSTVKGRFDVIPSSDHNFYEATDDPYADRGPSNLDVTVTFKIGNQAYTMFLAPSINIADAPLTPDTAPNKITESLDVKTNEIVGYFTDENPFAKAKDYDVTIDWGDDTPLDSFAGDGSDSDLGEVQTDPSLSAVNATHTYTETGTYTVTTTVTDISGAPPITLTSTVTVAAAPTIQLHGLPDATVGVPIGGTDPVAGTMGDALFGYVEFHDFQKHLSTDYEYQIDWGDGTPIDTSARLVGIGGSPANSFIVYATHTYQSAGDFTVTLDVLTLSGNVIATAAYDGPQDGEINRQEPVYPPNS
jgi:hypothetical protein